MISKPRMKFIKSLHVKKFRQKEGLFIAEGEKVVSELLQSRYKIHSLYCTKEWEAGRSPNKGVQANVISEDELKAISTLETPNKVLAVAGIPEKKIDYSALRQEITVVLDDIKDPGNLGTIIRTADWFGIQNIVCSESTVDAYNPKVVQAAMGSLFRVALYYENPETFFSTNQLRVYGALLNGKDIASQKIKKPSVLVLGSEANGISKQLLKFIDVPVTIPGGTGTKAESLNVSIAAGILFYEFMKEVR